jgi:leader peptidase (prepilin peptidase)/N-methyltransferase
MLLHLPVMVFIFCFGACVGSFLNVVIYRLPAGMSVISPPSRCPTCGARLRFFRENLPILGWFMIRGKCRYCGVRVSPQYMAIELLMALVFIGLYAVLFMTSRATPWWGEIGGTWWTANGVFRVWPAYVAFAFMLAGLLAMTMIDARTFTIPIQIPLFVTITAFIAYPLQALLPHRAPSSMTWPIPAVGWTGTLAAVGGMVGVLVGVALLKSGRLRYSFDDYDDYVKEGETLGDYPHARREMGRELLFLAPCVAGLVAGGLIGRVIGGVPPAFLQALGGTLVGYLVGGVPSSSSSWPRFLGCSGCLCRRVSHPSCVWRGGSFPTGRTWRWRRSRSCWRDRVSTRCGTSPSRACRSPGPVSWRTTRDGRTGRARIS